MGPALHLLGRLPMHAAIGTSVLVIAMMSFAGFAAYVQHVEVSCPLSGMLILVAAMGTLLGSLLANRRHSARLKCAESAALEKGCLPTMRQGCAGPRRPSDKGS